MPITSELGKTRKPMVTAIKVPSKETRMVRVACYCRTSTDLPSQEGSMEYQEKHLRHLVEITPNWVLVDSYRDEGLSGTDNANRPEFQRMMRDCRSGRIDLVITKSISRWGRHLTQTLESVHELIDLGVNVFFEKENLLTLSSTGTVILELMGSFAEYESNSIKQNTKMGYKVRMQRGIYKYKRPPYGYDADADGRLVVNAEEAEVVRRIFQMSIHGIGTHKIAKILQAEGVPTKRGADWQPTTIRAILTNITYTGDVILQKTIRVGNAPRKRNDGSEESYYVPEHHEPIIDHATFEAAQSSILARSRGRFRGDGKSTIRYPFSSHLTCSICGRHLQRQAGATEIMWTCAGYKAHICTLQPVPELDIKDAFKATVAEHEAWEVPNTDDNERLDENLCEQGKLRTLYGVLPPEQYTLRLNELQREETGLRKAIKAAGDAQALRNAAKQVEGRKWASYEPVFVDHVDLVLVGPDHMDFVFKCGLRITTAR